MVDLIFLRKNLKRLFIFILVNFWGEETGRNEKKNEVSNIIE
jgi:hypothetical protein